MTATAPAQLAAETAGFLLQHAPFDSLEDAALEFIAERAALVFYAAGSVILVPEMGRPRHFSIVRRGHVQARQIGTPTVTDYASLTLGPGEGFPIGALTAERPSTNSYTALDDCYLLQLGAADFHALCELSPRFERHCSRYIADLLSQSREQLQASFSQHAAEEQSMTVPLATLVQRAAVTVSGSTPARNALERMAAEGIGCLVVCDDGERPLGVLTDSDLLARVVLADVDLSQPIAALMSTPARQISLHATAYDAALAMATQRVRHLVAVDTAGRAAGVVSERDLFALQRLGLRQIRASIDGATALPALQQAGQDIRRLALSLVAQGVGAEQLTRFISALNDALTRRIITLAVERHGLQDAHFCWLAFGSEGREEQTLSSDQDNGILYEASGTQADALRERLLTCAGEINRDLAACGFPLCKGNIMAGNPELCLDANAWQARFEAWIRTPDPQALLNATIFFDFRVLWGCPAAADALRHHLNRAARANPAFLRMMAANALEVPPPLGRIRDFAVDGDGCIDLKKSGARLFVDAARILALQTDGAVSNTAARLRLAAPQLGIRTEEADAMLDGFHFIQLLRLRTQHLDTEHDAPGDNRIDPARLHELDRRILKEAFRQARKLQLRLKLDYQL